MDVESLAKQLILKNMTPEQQTAVLDSIRASVSQAKDVQKQRIGENVRMVVEALKKIEADIKTRYDETGKAIEKRVASIKDGKDGKDGVNGKDGRDGRPGKDGDTGPRGADGLNGNDGRDGVDGVSVTDAHIDFDGSLIISLSSGRVINVGEVVAPDLAEKIKVITNGGGTSQVVIDTLASLQTQINNLIPSQTGNSGKFLTTDGSSLSWSSVAGALTYQGTWNASTNTPSLTSSVGTSGYYYVVATAGSTNLNGISDWQVGDWLIFNGTVWQKIDQSEVLQTIASADSSVTVTTTGSNADLSVYSSPRLISQVRNETGATLTKGTVVYISGAAGNKATVSKAIATSDSTSAQTFGLVLADISNNNNGYAILAGDIAGLDTSAFTAGTQLYLSSTTAGAYTSTKQYAPNHLVYIGVVTRSHVNQGSIEVRIQNGYEMDELHNVSAQNPTNGQVLIYNESTALWEKANLTAGTGISVSNGAGSISVANTGVTSVGVTSPVASTGGATPTISLASGYGDTQNPFASKTANYVLAAPNGTAGAPTFRSIVAADIPTLNQNTTGTASNVTGTVAIANGGTGATTRQDAMDALAGSTTSGQYLRGNGTDVVMSTIQAADVPTLNQSTTGNAATATTATNVSGGTASVTTLTTSSTVTLNGGTANGVLYLNGSKVVTSGSALVYDGTVLRVNGSTTSGLRLASSSGAANGFNLYNDSSTDSAYVMNFYNGPLVFGQNNAEGMRLTSTGLGIGTSSPSNKLTVSGTGTVGRFISSNTGVYIGLQTSDNSSNYIGSVSGATVFQTNDTERMRLDTSGNLGLGVTPSAWTSYKALQISNSVYFYGYGNDELGIGQGAYYSSGWKYAATGVPASWFNVYQGTYKWNTAASGTAGNAISFTQAMTLDASGNLGVGTTSPSSFVGSGNKLVVGNASTTTTSAGISVYSGTATYGGLYFADGTFGNQAYRGAVEYNHSTDALLLYSAGAERARIDSSGNLLVGATTTVNAAKSVFSFSSSSNGVYLIDSTGVSGAQFMRFDSTPNTCGSITRVAATSAVTYNTTSDYRLKEVICAVSDSGSRIDALHPIEYTWKSDGTRTRGFLAHQFQEVYANSVTGTKDAVDADGNPEYQSMQAGSAEVIADLVAEIQSLRKRLANAGL